MRSGGISSPDGGEWSASLAGRFTPGETDPGTHCVGGLMGPEPVWALRTRETTLAPYRELNPYSVI
jgi:hypothetical protein